MPKGPQKPHKISYGFPHLPGIIHTCTPLRRTLGPSVTTSDYSVLLPVFGNDLCRVPRCGVSGNSPSSHWAFWIPQSISSPAVGTSRSRVLPSVKKRACRGSATVSGSVFLSLSDTPPSPPGYTDMRLLWHMALTDCGIFRGSV